MRKPSALVDYLLGAVASQGGSRNIIAFSGGVDSSLVAAVVHRVFPEEQQSLAVLGRSAALPKSQLLLAREVASHIGIQLHEVDTAEGRLEGYVANNGQACFHCKSELYSTLEAVAAVASRRAAEPPNQSSSSSSLLTRAPFLDDGKSTPEGLVRSVVLFNGTNADDRTDPTRVGLKAAADFNVASPLDTLTKDEVRAAAKHLGLPNWRHAASPCLRSRLALGVLATDDALLRVERAEELVRANLDLALRSDPDHRNDGVHEDGLGVHRNMRVRTLSGGRAVVEVDHDLVPLGQQHLLANQALVAQVLELGFSTFELRPFKSGNVSKPVM